MASQQNGSAHGNPTNDFTVKAGLAQMLKGGVIMDVVNAEQVFSFSRRCTSEMVDLALGPHRRRSWGRRRDGPGAGPRRYQSSRWRRSHVRPEYDQGDHGGRHHPCHG